MVDFAQFPGALPDTDTYVKLIDALVRELRTLSVRQVDLDPDNQDPDMWEVMFWPIVACVLLPWLLVYLGLHVVQRGIIFIDIAMAQMASLGICVAVLFHLNLESWPTFAIALGFTLLGAAIFSFTGKRTSQIPQEAIIGIAYVVAAAAAVLLLSRAAEGDEEIKTDAGGQYPARHARSRSGNASDFSSPSASCISSCAGIFCSSPSIATALTRKACACAGGIFFFMPLFGLVVTSFVRIAGVLLVFSYLIVPAVCGINLARSLRTGCSSAGSSR